MILIFDFYRQHYDAEKSKILEPKKFHYFEDRDELIFKIYTALGFEIDFHKLI